MVGWRNPTGFRRAKLFKHGLIGFVFTCEVSHGGKGYVWSTCRLRHMWPGLVAVAHHMLRRDALEMPGRGRSVQTRAAATTWSTSQVEREEQQLGR